MILTILNAIGLIILGLSGFMNWETLGGNGAPPQGIPTEMLMPVFFGGAVLICVGFSRMHFRHGLYGGLIVAMLGIASALIRLYDYGYLSILSQPKSQIIAGMGVLCVLQLFTSWHGVQKDREVAPPH